MMKQDKRRLLAVALAAVAVLALAGSATASAAVWKENGVTVTKSFSMSTLGPGSYEAESGVGGVQCSERFTISFNETTKATTISAFENKGSCKTFGSYAACTASTVEAIGLPWTVTLNATTLTINNMHMKHTFKVGCAKPEINKTLNVTLTPDLTTKISTFESLGTSTPYKQFGSSEIEGTNKGKYGIG